MKALLLIFTFLFFGCAQPLAGQNPLVGTWELKTDSIWSVKIITPTHWMAFTESRQGDSSKFVRSHGGTYTLRGNKYIEHIKLASWPDHDKAITDFTFKVAGNKFYQQGSVTLGDGTVLPVNETWQKVSIPKSYPKNPALGAWNQLSSTYFGADGKKQSHTKATATRFEIITPTHWMRISHRNNKFENAFGGPYTLEGTKMLLTIGFASFPYDQDAKAEATQEVIGDKRYVHGTAMGADGKTILTWDDVFQKADGKPQVIKSAAHK